MTRRVKTEAIENLKRVVDSNESGVDVSAHMDLVEKDALDDSIKVDKHLQVVNKELQDRAEEVVTDTPEKEKVPVQNTYTAPLKLAEDMSDFETKKDGRSHRTDEEDDYDDHMDFDMFDFIIGLVSDTWPKPKNPFKKRPRKFQLNGYDDYLEGNGQESVTQVATDYNTDSVVVYAPQESDFDDCKQICDYYKLEYSEIEPKRSKYSHWNFRMKIKVPMAADNYPMMAVDYIESIGMDMKDVMPKDWYDPYMKKVAKYQKEQDQFLADKASARNDEKVAELFKAATERAWSDGTLDLDVVFSELVAQLDAAGLTYTAKKLKKQFDDEFKDDFEDEE